LYNELFKEKPYKIKISKEPVILIGNDVWIGDNVLILPNLSIGDGAIIAAGSVVTKSVLPYTIVAGVPAVKIKDRFNEDIKKELLDLKWWEWDDIKIKNNK
jgi:acetyltransferase-like isoleucine patch superfamily enzyme